MNRLWELKIFSGNANAKLTEDICKALNMETSASKVEQFSDGETNVKILESVRGNDCYIIQPTCEPTNQNIMELLIMMDALKRASASRITAVIPYFGYARADRKTQPRVPITAKLVANLIAKAGADRVMAIDLHAGQIQGFFDIPADHLQARPVLLDYLKKLNLKDIAVVSPDVGGVERARKFAARLDASLAIIDKRRPKPNQAQVLHIIGDVKDKNCIIVDDIVDTAGTIKIVSENLKKAGAKKIYAVCSHGVLSGKGVENINNSELEELVITDTLPVDRKLGKKVKTLSVAKILAEAIIRNHRGDSISEMFM
ncbi:MAG: ribose-phosphate pyrophosphokinase [Elusimicrobiaceae bacterium]|nr:ribose-phosphate pyrophosphokinase [Elusimicrobiaceae bacterium]MBT3954753.1 ribose-phosphate pyrophosphokinase [Elusimicrobiaceae bacterium]MBT4008058.1 ribose-phosphate pyrophosphokinase [Elusimicrobiaceae bacterium]MBT4402617.1 ribose-phosphate pyrophosphokinase [Elusimicrobiaceae bacterium]MBT4439491.1 ribose-phosphate pyrophosphokinase [Elusimicrobiaceae bacterium]